MVVNGVRFALLGLRVFSTLTLTGLDGGLAFLMRACALLALRSSLGMSVLFFGTHVTPPVLHLAAIAAYLLRSVIHTVGDGLRIGLISVGKRVLILGGSVVNPLFRTGAIGGAEIPAD